MNEIGSKLIDYINQNRVSKIKKILKEHPNVVHYQGIGGLTPLIMAVQCDSTECIELFLNAGSNIDLQDEDGMTALMWASWYNKIECVLLLLQAGANTDLQDNEDGYTALMDASEKGRTECVKLLLRAGANPNLRSKAGWTAYDVASNEDIKKLLLNAMNLWSVMPLYKKLPTDLLRKTLEMMFSKKAKKINNKKTKKNNKKSKKKNKK